MRELLDGPKRFTALRTALPGINPKTLSARLQRFELTGLVTRTAYAEVPPRVEYALTPAGQRLEAVLAGADRVTIVVRKQVRPRRSGA